VGGTCACAAGESYCSTPAGGTGCFDLASDNLNCGACGAACLAGQACTAGSCQCGVGQSYCSTLAGGTGCVDLASDQKNCGACGNDCATGESCIAGACQCATGESYCATAAGGTGCFALDADRNNCGGCGNVCPMGEVCNGAGGCTATCADPYTACGSGASSYCADLTIDPQHCGACGTACGVGQVCLAGNCFDACNGPGNQVCGGTCVDTDSDEDNCGACGQGCAANPSQPGYCSSGACVCAPGNVFCGNGAGCQNTWYNDTDCGGGGPFGKPIDCAALGELCNGGNCQGIGLPQVLAPATNPSVVVTATNNPGPGPLGVLYYLVNGTTVMSASSSSGGPSGGGPTTVAGGFTGASGLAVTNDTLFVMDASHLWQCPLPCSSPTPITAVKNGTDLIANPNGPSILWAQEGSGPGAPDSGVFSLWMGSSTPQQLAGGQGQVQFLATDGINLYWTDTADGTVLEEPVNGGALTTLASAQSKPTVIAVSSQFVYFGTTNAIERVSPGGGVTKVAAAQNPLGMVTDQSGLYWTNAGSGTVMKLPVCGTAPLTLATGQSNPTGIAVDWNDVYWANDSSSGQVLALNPR
jgi:hypothetical protein